MHLLPTAILNMLQETNMGSISSHLSKERCNILLFDVVSMVTKYKNGFN